MQIAAIATLVQGVITLAPYVEKAAIAAHDFIDRMVEDNQISIADQEVLKAHVDAVYAAVISGKTPPEFTVEADPAAK